MDRHMKVLFDQVDGNNGEMMANEMDNLTAWLVTVCKRSCSSIGNQTKQGEPERKSLVRSLVSGRNT
jgi:hypothetical protein